MRERANDWIWDQKMRHHLGQDYQHECVSLYRKCYDYSPEHFYDDIMAFVTKAFILSTASFVKFISLIILTIFYNIIL